MWNRNMRLVAGFLGWILLLTSSYSLAEDHRKDSIMVWRLEGKEGVTEENLDLISGFVASQVERFSDRRVTSEKDVQSIFKGEEKKQKCGADDTICLTEIVAALGVPEVVSGEVGRIGDFWMLNLRFTNVRRVEVVNRTSRQVEGSINELIKSIPGAVAELFGKEHDADKKGSISIKTEPPGASLLLNGKDIGSSPFKKTVAIGKYKVSASLEKYKDSSWSGEVKLDKTTDVSLKLEEHAYPMNPYKLWGHVAFWSGIGFAAFGALSTGMAKTEGDNASSATSWSAKTDAEDASRSWMGGAITGYALGGALMTTGVVLWILSPGDKEWAGKNEVSAGVISDGKRVAVSIGGRW